MRFRFEDCELDPAEARLTRAGRPVELQPKLIEALHFFVQRPQRLVTHDELMEGLWPEVHVNEEALQQIVSKLRRALGDAAREPRFLQTVPKRGYRFLPAVEVVAEPAPMPAPASTRPPAPASTRPPAPASTRPPAPAPAPPPAPAPLTLALPALPDTPLQRSRLLVALGALLAAALAAGLVAAHHPGPAAPLPPSAGAVHRLTHSLERKQEGAFSPDERTVVFAANDAREGQYDLFLLATAEGSAAVRLTHTPAEEFYPQLAPDGGTILFSRSDAEGPSLWTIPPTGGAERKVAAQACFGTFSPDGRAVAFARPLGSGSVSLVVRALEGGVERTVATVPGPVQSLRWSSEGTLAFSDERRVWTLPATGGTPQVLGQAAQYLRSLDWDPRAPAVVADPNWSGRSGLWSIPRGGAPLALGTTLGGVHHPALSRDGSRVLFTSESKHQLFLRLDASGKLSPLDVPTSFDCVDVDAAGRRVAGTDWEAGLEDRVSVCDLGTGRREILGEGRCPRFSPDGERLAYLRSENGKAAALWTLDLRSREAGPVGLHAGEPLGPPSWSPDGRSLAAVTRDEGGVSALVVVSLEGGAPRRVTEGSFGALAWAPDGRSLAATSGGGTTLIDAQAGTARRLSARGSYENAPLWSSDGSQLGVLVDERRAPALVTLGLDGQERGRVALPVQMDPSFWGTFTLRPLGNDRLLVQTRYEGDLYVLDLVR